MALKKLTDNSTNVNFNNDLPWLNEWCKGREDKDKERLIWKVIDCPSGLMVMCSEYKAMIYANTIAYQDLLEAIEAFHKSQSHEAALYVVANRWNKPEILVDTEVKSHRWYKTENTFVQVMPGEDIEKKSERKNPLLAGREVRTESTIAESGEQTTTEAEKISPATTGRAKKGLDKH
jgi:hypothetical protein